mmetsp:Transcript_27478/g.42637  ORF Transcript_27478/g.42637 Transcript_27478/m.42637 type:complete len:158 (-) Transcript_27478:217-690(-)
MKTAALFLSLIASTAAFSVTPPTRRALVPSTTAVQALMSEEETKSIINSAHDCADSECSVEDVEMFLSELKEQQIILRNRLSDVTKMIDELGHVNIGTDRKVDEVRETVRAIARLFMMGDKASGNDYPMMGTPMGYSGEVGEGPKTAYDVLSPKKSP